MSNSYLESCINFPLDSNVLLDVVDKAKDWALMHGAGLRSKASFNPDVMQVLIVVCIDMGMWLKKWMRKKSLFRHYKWSFRFHIFFIYATWCDNHEFTSKIEIQMFTTVIDDSWPWKWQTFYVDLCDNQ